MKQVLIFGAGSVGNHMAHASCHLGASVDVVDCDSSALERMKNEIYPQRYGKWNDGISLFRPEDAPKKDYDLIIIGTPPDTHLKILKDSLVLKPNAILVEKPLCEPDLAELKGIYDQVKESEVRVFTGYNHLAGKVTLAMDSIIDEVNFGKIRSIEVEFKESWQGIFNAHPWLSGPKDTYLGFWRRGGGALGEHSHGVSLWQHISQRSGQGRIKKITALINYNRDGIGDYDELASLHLESETGIKGRLVQDVLTNPHRKWGRLTGEKATVDWECLAEPGIDRITLYTVGDDIKGQEFRKTRPDDFISELELIRGALQGQEVTPLDFEEGLKTMLVICAAHLSAQTNKSVEIDYSQNFGPESLKVLHE